MDARTKKKKDRTYDMNAENSYGGSIRDSFAYGGGDSGLEDYRHLGERVLTAELEVSSLDRR